MGAAPFPIQGFAQPRHGRFAAEVARDAGSAKTSKHFLRMYCSNRQRVQRGDIVISHVADVENPSDFLTKWLQSKKLDESVRRATGAAAGETLFPRPKA